MLLFLNEVEGSLEQQLLDLFFEAHPNETDEAMDKAKKIIESFMKKIKVVTNTCPFWPPNEPGIYGVAPLDNEYWIFCINNEYVIMKRAEISNFRKPPQHYIDEACNSDRILYQPIEKLELSNRSEECLKSNGIFTVRQLIKWNWEDLLKTPNFGRKSLREIEDVLHKHKLFLHQE